MHRLFLLAILLTTVLSQAALAQGESAEPMRGGSLRIGFGGEWAHWTDRFGRPNPANPLLRDGARDPNGSYFSADSIGTARLPSLAPAEDELRAITGLGTGYAINLGRAALRLDASVRSTPLRIDYAPSRRFGLSVAVPLVRARMSISLRGPDDSASATLGNVGLNPAFATPGAFTAFRSEVELALEALRVQATSGPIALRGQAQALIDQYQAALCGMYALAGGSASATTSPCFRAIVLEGSPVLPVDTSEAGDSLTALLTRSQADYAALRAQYQSNGIGIPAFGASYTLPTAPLDSLGLRQVFSTSAGSLASDSLTEVVRTGIGDMEVGAWLQLSESSAWRSQLAFLVRLPTGSLDDAANLVDIGTGDHQMDIEVASRNDIALGRRLRLYVGARFGLQMADELERRVTPYYFPIATAASLAMVRRNLGDYIAIDVAPHWQLDESFEVGFGYHYFRQGATTFEYLNSADEAAIGLPASVLGEGTEMSRMRAGAGITYSTLSRYYSGRARLPLRVTWSYQSTLWGRGGQTPIAGVMSLNIQTHIKL